MEESIPLYQQTVFMYNGKKRERIRDGPMYKLVIIDDEPTVRTGLRHYFDWNAYNIEFAGDADDGDLGLELIERVRPDLVLTDVRMVNMDGIRMSAQVRERYPHVGASSRTLSAY